MNLLSYKKNFRSQNGEDGIIEKIFSIIQKKTPGYFVEFGAWDGEFLSNTYSLLKNDNWSGCYIEGDSKKYEQLNKKYRKSDNVICVNKFVESGKGKSSLTKILNSNNVPNEFDLLSIDIDGNDYEVWRDLGSNFQPKLVVIEYNQTIPPSVEFIDKGGVSFMGSSCLALYKLAKDKGYEMLTCTETNCFFIRKDFYCLFLIDNNTPSFLQNTDKLCFVCLNHSGELVFSNKNFFQNQIVFILYKRFKKIIKHVIFKRSSFFYLYDKYK
jgi:hypothetical protein